jgi:hypothetical protein
MSERDEEWLGHQFGPDITREMVKSKLETPLRKLPVCPTYPQMYRFCSLRHVQLLTSHRL